MFQKTTQSLISLKRTWVVNYDLELKTNIQELRNEEIVVWMIPDRQELKGNPSCGGSLITLVCKLLLANGLHTCYSLGKFEIDMRHFA